MGGAGSRREATAVGSRVLKLFLTQKYPSEIHLIIKKRTPFLKLHGPGSVYSSSRNRVVLPLEMRVVMQ